MPKFVVLLSDNNPIVPSLGVELLVLLGADGADFQVITAQVALRVEKRVDVESRGRWTTGELSKPQN